MCVSLEAEGGPLPAPRSGHGGGGIVIPSLGWLGEPGMALRSVSRFRVKVVRLWTVGGSNSPDMDCQGRSGHQTRPTTSVRDSGSGLSSPGPSSYALHQEVPSILVAANDLSRDKAGDRAPECPLRVLRARRKSRRQHRFDQLAVFESGSDLQHLPNALGRAARDWSKRIVRAPPTLSSAIGCRRAFRRFDRNRSCSLCRGILAVHLYQSNKGLSLNVENPKPLTERRQQLVGVGHVAESGGARTNAQAVFVRFGFAAKSTEVPE